MAQKIVKQCIHHGALVETQCNKSGTHASGHPAWKCKACHKVHRDNNFARNRDKILAKTMAYKKAYPEKYAACQQAYRNRLKKEAGVPSRFLDNVGTDRNFRRARNRLVNVMCSLSLITRAIEKQSRKKS